MRSFKKCIQWNQTSLAPQSYKVVLGPLVVWGPFLVHGLFIMVISSYEPLVTGWAFILTMQKAVDKLLAPECDSSQGHPVALVVSQHFLRCHTVVAKRCQLHLRRPLTVLSLCIKSLP